MAADLPVDGAHVDARPAAQAVKRLPERAGDLRDAAVVEQDQVELVGSFQLAGPSRSLHERRVDGELLAGRTLGENGQEYGEVRHGRDDLFHAHHRHVHAGQRGRHAAVALVGDEDHRARLGHGEVGAGDAEVGGEKFLAQFLARDLGEHLGVGGQAGPLQLAREQLGHLALRLVDRGGDDVRGPLVGELDDVLAEVGLHRRHADGLQRIVEMNLLGGHRLGFHGHPGAGPPGDVEHDVARLLRGRREVHVAAEPLDVRHELVEMLVQALEGRLLDGAGTVAQTLSLGKIPEGLAAQRDELGRRDIERLVQEPVAEGLGGALPQRRGHDRLGHLIRRRGACAGLRRPTVGESSRAVISGPRPGVGPVARSRGAGGRRGSA